MNRKCLISIALLVSIAMATFAGTPTPTPTPSGLFPLKKSSNNHYLVTQHDDPFLIVGDSAWEMPIQGTNADIDLYLANRAAKGFNTVLIQLIDNTYSTHAPNNIDNIPPFTGAFLTTPNNTYFNRVDYILQQADRYGMQCLVFPLFTGYNCGDDGYGGQIAAASNADLTSFANYLAARYGSQGNIIWVMGGDSDPVACGFSAKVSTFATALHSADPGHLITEHNARNSEAVTPWLSTSVPSWLTLNDTYTDRYTYALGAAAYSRSPTKPFFHIEAYYEHDSHNLSKQEIRKQSYWAVLSGAAGYMFGSCPLWGLGSSGSSTTCNGAPGTWQAEMDDTGSANMTKFANLFSSRAWQTLVPDFSHTLVTAGYGTSGTANYVTASRSADGALAIAYLPVNATITVDMTKLAGTTTARWYDPANGSYSTVSGSPFSNTGTHSFDHSGSNSAGDSDWVLVLESAGSPTPTPSAPNNLQIHSATIEQDNPTPVEPTKRKSSLFARIAAVALNTSANIPTSPPLKPLTLQWDARPSAQGALYCNTNQEISADFCNCRADVYVLSPIDYTFSIATLPDGIGAKIRINGVRA